MRKTSRGVRECHCCARRDFDVDENHRIITKGNCYRMVNQNTTVTSESRRARVTHAKLSVALPTDVVRCSQRWTVPARREKEPDSRTKLRRLATRLIIGCRVIQPLCEQKAHTDDEDQNTDILAVENEQRAGEVSRSSLRANGPLISRCTKCNPVVSCGCASAISHALFYFDSNRPTLGEPSSCLTRNAP